MTTGYVIISILNHHFGFVLIVCDLIYQSSLKCYEIISFHKSGPIMKQDIILTMKLENKTIM